MKANCIECGVQYGCPCQLSNGLCTSCANKPRQ